VGKNCEEGGVRASHGGWGGSFFGSLRRRKKGEVLGKKKGGGAEKKSTNTERYDGKIEKKREIHITGNLVISRSTTTSVETHRESNQTLSKGQTKGEGETCLTRFISTERGGGKKWR